MSLSSARTTPKCSFQPISLLPTQTVQEVRSGKKRIMTRKFFPGYVLVELELNDDTWQLIKHTQGVIGFLGGVRPTPLTADEVAEMFNQLEASKEKIAPRVMFSAGDRVKIHSEDGCPYTLVSPSGSETIEWTDRDRAIQVRAGRQSWLLHFGKKDALHRFVSFEATEGSGA